uniref:Uncharacterized protein n=1 Tax=Tanacetum cinerariifolium TaxID=118510 RepID=A0A6L2JQQ2_TANCI|nr:hypothetical protein [Tanacetum cinerariifolium]
MFYKHASYNNHESSGFDQPLQFTPPQPLPREMLSLRNSNHDPLCDLYYPEGSNEEDINIDSLTKEPFDTFSMRDKKIKLNSLEDIDDLVPILNVFKKPLDSFD